MKPGLDGPPLVYPTPWPAGFPVLLVSVVTGQKGNETPQSVCRLTIKVGKQKHFLDENSISVLSCLASLWPWPWAQCHGACASCRCVLNVRVKCGLFLHSILPFFIV